MRKLLLSTGVLLLFAATVQAQAPVTKANYQAASRYSPKKLKNWFSARR